MNTGQKQRILGDGPANREDSEFQGEPTTATATAVVLMIVLLVLLFFLTPFLPLLFHSLEQSIPGLNTAAIAV